jgi:hypothetical protein
VGVQAGGRFVPRNLERFLVATGTTAFLAIKGDTLLCVAIAEGRIGSVDDPITRYLPELADRDPVAPGPAGPPPVTVPAVLSGR